MRLHRRCKNWTETRRVVYIVGAMSNFRSPYAQLPAITRGAELRPLALLLSLALLP